MVLSLASTVLLLGGLLFCLRSVALVRRTDSGMYVFTLFSGGEVGAQAVSIVRQFGSGIEVGAFAAQRFILFSAAGRFWVCKLSAWQV